LTGADPSRRMPALESTHGLPRPCLFELRVETGTELAF
jgi:hypothetical protein